MITKSFSNILVIFVLALDAQGLKAATAREPDGMSSARLMKLAHDWEAGNRKTAATFWKEMEGKAPLVEAIEGNPHQRLVTFVWRGSNNTSRVTMIGGLPGPNILKPLRPLADTDVWFLSEIHSTEARFQYVFQINGPEAVRMELAAIMKAVQGSPPRKDPLNFHRTYAGWSYVELPDAPSQPWIEKRANVPAGRMIPEKFKSQILNAEYPLSVYTPPGYEEDSRRCWLLMAFDGGFNMQDVTLDNLLAAGKIPPWSLWGFTI